MVALLGLVIVFLLAYIGSTWATIAQLRERNAQLQAVLERRGGAWHEIPIPAKLPAFWDDGCEQTLQSPSLPDDKTDEHAMVFE